MNTLVCLPISFRKFFWSGITRSKFWIVSYPWSMCPNSMVIISMYFKDQITECQNRKDTFKSPVQPPPFQIRCCVIVVSRNCQQDDPAPHSSDFTHFQKHGAFGLCSVLCSCSFLCLEYPYVVSWPISPHGESHRVFRVNKPSLALSLPVRVSSQSVLGQGRAHSDMELSQWDSSTHTAGSAASPEDPALNPTVRAGALTPSWAQTKCPSHWKYVLWPGPSFSSSPWLLYMGHSDKIKHSTVRSRFLGEGPTS
jgi:hypothetical protein